MCLCMCVRECECVYVLYVCMYVCMYVAYMCVFVYVCAWVWVCVCTVCMYVCMYVCSLYVCVCVYKRVCVCLSVLFIECNFSYSYNYLQVKEYDIWMYFAWKCTTLIKMLFSQFFVQNVVFLMKPMCIQVVIKHEHMKIEYIFLIKSRGSVFYFDI